MRKGFLMMLLGLLVLTAPMFGAISIDFGTGDAGTGGTFTLLSGGNAKGQGIPIDTLTVSGAGAADGVYDVDGVTTGSGESGVGTLEFNTQTNVIAIVGSIVCQNTLGACTGHAVGDTIVANTALLTGSFNSFTANNFGLLNATGPDTKAASLLTALGIPLSTKFSYFGFSLTTGGVAGGSVISTDIQNTSVPEPSSIVLFGVVLLGCCALMRRRKMISTNLEA